MANHPPKNTKKNIFKTLTYAVLLSVVTLGAIIGIRKIMFSPLPVTFHFDPQGVKVTLNINGTESYSGSDQIIVALPEGKHQIDLVSPGFERYQNEIEVYWEKENQFDIELKLMPGFLTVKAVEMDTKDPVEGVKIAIDGEPKGNLPLSVFSIEAGSHQLKIEPPKEYIAKENTKLVEIQGKAVDQEVTFELQPNQATYTFTTKPQGAVIRSPIQGNRVLGSTANGSKTLTFNLWEGDVGVLSFELYSYQTASWSETMVAGENKRVYIELTPSPGKIFLRTDPPDTDIFINGELIKENLLQGYNLEANKDHQILITKQGYDDFKIPKLRFAPGQIKKRAVKLTSQSGQLRITADLEATVLVDGDFIGFTPIDQRLSVGMKQVLVKASGFPDQQATVEVIKEGLASLNLKFQKEGKNLNLGPPLKKLPDSLDLLKGLKMVLIKPGSFTQGDNGPTIQITKPFYVSTTEIPTYLYEELTESYRRAIKVKGININLPDYPAIKLSWNDAAHFCNLLSKEVGFGQSYTLTNNGYAATKESMQRGIRLPTEAEFEYMLRYGDPTKSRKYPWGNTWPPEKLSGNYADQSGRDAGLGFHIPEYDDGNAFTAPVHSMRSLKPSIYNLSGNVSEWCHDTFERSFWSSADIKDPVNYVETKSHVIKGGSYESAIERDLRVSWRKGLNKDQESLDVGFRIILPAEAYRTFLEQ